MALLVYLSNPYTESNFSLRIPLLAMVRVNTGIDKKLKSPRGTGYQINNLVPKDQKVKKTTTNNKPLLKR